MGMKDIKKPKESKTKEANTTLKDKKKNIFDKITDKLNKAGEAYLDLGKAGLNVLRGDVPGFKKGGLVKSGKPKIAKKGWK